MHIKIFSIKVAQKNTEERHSLIAIFCYQFACFPFLAFLQQVFAIKLQAMFVFHSVFMRLLVKVMIFNNDMEQCWCSYMQSLNCLVCSKGVKLLFSKLLQNVCIDASCLKHQSYVKIIRKELLAYFSMYVCFLTNLFTYLFIQL